MLTPIAPSTTNKPKLSHVKVFCRVKPLKGNEEPFGNIVFMQICRLTKDRQKFRSLSQGRKPQKPSLSTKYFWRNLKLSLLTNVARLYLKMHFSKIKAI